MKKVTLSETEIERYWGSLEAYTEEQRRCGLVELEAAQSVSEYDLNHSGVTSAEPEVNFEKPHTPGFHFNFHFGHHA